MFGNSKININVIAKQYSTENDAWGKGFYDKVRPQVFID